MASDTEEWPRFQEPVHRDPLREYDLLARNQPRVLGFMELVARPLPWMLQAFTGRVPENFIAQVDVSVVEVPCPCKAVTAIPHNVLTPCEGACGRYFWYFAGAVRVAYVSAQEQEDQDQEQEDHGGDGGEDEGAELL